MSNRNQREVLTSRERVRRALRKEPVDRVPIDLGAHPSTGISAFAYWNLRQYLGLSTNGIEITDMVQLLARVDHDVGERFHIDTVLLHPGWAESTRWSPREPFTFTVPNAGNPVRREDGSWLFDRHGKRMILPEDGFFLEGDHAPFDDYSADEYIGRMAREAERLYKETDAALLYLAFDGYFRFEDPEWLCALAEAPESLVEENGRQSKIDLETCGKVLDRLGKYVEAICITSDLGTQHGPVCSTSQYEQVCAPFIRRLADRIHAHSDCKVFMHSCGAIRPFIPILIDCGIDVLNPVQISASGMEPAALKADFGSQLVFWGGGCDTQRVLGRATPEEIKEHVHGLMDLFKPGSGYVFNQVHNIMGNVPPEQIVALFDAAYEASWMDQ